MNIAEWRKLGEALEVYESIFPSEMDGLMPPMMSPIVAAARRDRDRYQECDNPHCKDGELFKESSGQVCPSCGESGLRPSETYETDGIPRTQAEREDKAARMKGALVRAFGDVTT